MTDQHLPQVARPGEPAWLPDPSGRHQLRWWDGSIYTAVVADDGVRGVDAAGVPPSWAGAGAQAPAGPIVAASPGGSAQPGAGGRRRTLLVAGLAVVGVLVIAAFGAAVLTDRFGGGDGGAGAFEGEVDPGAAGLHEVTVAPGEVLLVTVDPASRIDVVVGLLVDDDGADLVDDLYGDLVDVAGSSDPADAFGALDDDALDELGEGVVVLRTDIGFAGEEEAVLLVVGGDRDDDLELTVVVAPFEDDEGAYSIELERFGLSTDAEELADLDGLELLEAVADDRELPVRVTALADDLLELTADEEP